MCVCARARQDGALSLLLGEPRALLGGGDSLLLRARASEPVVCLAQPVGGGAAAQGVQLQQERDESYNHGCVGGRRARVGPARA